MNKLGISNVHLLARALALLLVCGIPALSLAQAVYTGEAIDYQPAYVQLNGELGGMFNSWQTCWFEWGLTTNYGNTVAAQDEWWQTGPFVFQSYITLANPPPTTIYHFRAASVYGYGGDATFVTPGLPIITNQPQSQAVTPGSTVTLTVGAYGRGLNPYSPWLSYQWQSNSVPITSANGSTFTITNMQRSDVGTYTVVVGNQDGSVTSSPASITLLLPLPFMLANRTNGKLVLSWPVSTTNYNLKTSTDLRSTNWSNVPATMVTNSNRISATIPASALNGQQQFFKLKYP